MKYDNAPMNKGGAALFITVIVVGLATIFTGESKADELGDSEFMEMETERARITEANGECRIAGALGADVQGCVSAYLCTNYGDCEGEGMKPLEPTPWGVYRDTSGVSND